MTNATTDDDAAARRRAADRERKRAARAAAREARGDAEAGSRACAHGPSASASESESVDLATLDGIRSTLEWALLQVRSDRTNSPTNRARVAAQIAREASALLQVHTLAERVAAIESAMAARQEKNR